MIISTAISRLNSILCHSPARLKRDTKYFMLIDRSFFKGTVLSPTKTKVGHKWCSRLEGSGPVDLPSNWEEEQEDKL